MVPQGARVDPPIHWQVSVELLHWCSPMIDLISTVIENIFDRVYPVGSRIGLLLAAAPARNQAVFDVEMIEDARHDEIDDL